MLEMKETAFICNNVSAGSLILLDELGRATSNEDGVAIAWAVSEFLLSKKAMTFFVTHYSQLCQLSNVYPTVQNQHLKASLAEGDSRSIQYSHKVSPGPCSVTPDYGVAMATCCGWPTDVVENVRDAINSRRYYWSSIELQPFNYPCPVQHHRHVELSWTFKTSLIKAVFARTQSILNPTIQLHLMSKVFSRIFLGAWRKRQCSQKHLLIHCGRHWRWVSNP